MWEHLPAGCACRILVVTMTQASAAGELCSSSLNESVDSRILSPIEVRFDIVHESDMQEPSRGTELPE